MASVQKRPDGRYRARYRDPAGKEHAKHFQRKVDAQRWLDQMTSSIVTNRYIDPQAGRVPTGQWARTWIDGKANLKASTRDRYEGIIETHVEPAWGTVKLCDITHDGVQAWIAELSAAGLSAWSVVKVHRVMSMLLDYAVKAHRLATNPAVGVDLPRITKPHKRYLKRQQVENRAEAAGHRRAIVRVLAYGGLRWGELAALRVKRFNRLLRRLSIEESVTEVNGGKLDWGLPKDHEARWVPVPRFLIEDLCDQIAGKAPDDLIFTSPKGAVLRVGGARRSWFDRAVRLAGTAVSTAQAALGMPVELRDGIYGESTTEAARRWQEAHGLVVDGIVGRETWASMLTVTGDDRFEPYAEMTLLPGSQDFPTDLHPNELRHTAASLAVSAGANVKAVQRMLGHAKASMTLDVYADLFDDDFTAVADRLDEIAEAADHLRTEPSREASRGQATSA